MYKAIKRGCKKANKKKILLHNTEKTITLYPPRGPLGLTEVTTGAQLLVLGLATGLGALPMSSMGSHTDPVRELLGNGLGGIMF